MTKKLVILGGGYGGLTLARELLEKELPANTVVILVDRLPYQGLITEYYALASGTMPEVDIRVPFPIDPRLILKYGDVSSVDLEKQVVRFSEEDMLSYDWLVIALGCVDKFHGIPGADIYTNSIQLTFRTLESSKKIFLGWKNKVEDLGEQRRISL
jgi:NADH dehydrogenase